MPETCRSWRSKLPCSVVLSCLVSLVNSRSSTSRSSSLANHLSLPMRSMSRLQNFVGIHVVGRQKRQRGQVAEEIPKPDSSDSDRHNDVGHSHDKRLGEIRLDDPKQVEVADQHQPDRQPYQPADIALEWTREQQRKRDDEAE